MRHQINNIKNRNHTKKKETRILKGDNFDIPFYNLQNQKVWGATAMMLSEFEQIVKDCISNN